VPAPDVPAFAELRFEESVFDEFAVVEPGAIPVAVAIPVAAMASETPAVPSIAAWPEAAIGRGLPGTGGFAGVVGKAEAAVPDEVVSPGLGGVCDVEPVSGAPAGRMAGIPFQCGPWDCRGWSIRTKKTRRGDPAGGRGGSSSGGDALVMAVRSVGTIVTIR